MTFGWYRLPAGWHRLPGLVRVGLVLAGLGLVALPAWKWGWPAFREWRKVSNLREAERALASGDAVAARDLAMSVLQSGDPAIGAFRTAIVAMQRLDDPRAEDLAWGLLRHRDARRDDWLTGFRSMTSHDPLARVGAVWAGLPAELQRDPDFALPFARRLHAEGRNGEAVRVLHDADAGAGGRGDWERGVARILVGIGRWEGLEEVQRRVLAGLGKGGEEAREWFRIFEEIPTMALEPGTCVGVGDWLRGGGSGDSDRDDLAAARIRYVSDFPGRSDFIEESVSKWRSERPGLLAEFLIAIGLHGRVAEEFSEEDARRDARVFRALLTAFERTSEPARAARLLDADPGVLPKAEWNVRRAAAADREGRAGLRDDVWEAAFREAAGDPRTSALLGLHQLASKHGLEAQSEQALIEALLRGRGPLPLHEDLRNLVISLRRRGRENTLLRIAAVYKVIEPGNPRVLCQHVYLRCLLGLVDPETAVEELRPLLAAFPKELAVRCAMATALLADERAEEAEKVLQEADVTDPDSLPPSDRIVFLAVARRRGTIPADDPRLLDIPWPSLLPCERVNFGRWLGRRKPE